MPAFGKVDKADLQLKSCPFEPSANAMKLFDLQEFTLDLFNYGTKLKTEHRIRIKIFNEKGYKYASVRIPYFRKKGVAKIKQFDGIIYNLDASGNVVKEMLHINDFFTEKAAENIGIVNFTFPNVRPGSIIEYSYTTIENDVFSIPPWVIQGEIPVAYSEAAFATPAQSGMLYRAFGIDSIEQTMYYLKNDQFKRTTYFKSDINSFQPEPFMSSYNDHLIRAVFILTPYSNSSENISSKIDLMWKNAGSSLLRSDYFGKQIGGIIPGTETIIDSSKKIQHITDRIGFIYESVQKKWSGYHEQTFEARDLTEAWKNGVGTSAEINLILLNLLEKADIKCFPVLISTRNNGKVNKDFPSLGQLNGVDIMAFDSAGFYLLDASLKYQSFRNPPVNILNREAFAMSPESMQWITVVHERPLLKQSINLIAEMKADGKMEGTANIQFFDYAKSNRLDSSSKDEDDKTEEKFIDKKPAGLKIISSRQDVTENAADPLFETIDFIYEPQNTNESFYYINPLLFTQTRNPFLAEKRETDIDLGCNQLSVLSMQLDLQDSFLVDDLPKNITIMAPDSSFFYKTIYSVTGQKIFISQIFEIKRALFSSTEYKGIQDFFKAMLTAMNVEIILKRKK